MYNDLFNGYLSVVDKAIQSQIEIFTSSNNNNEIPAKLYDTFAIGYITGFCNIAEAVSGLHEAEHKELSLYRKILKRVYGERNIKTVLSNLTLVETNSDCSDNFISGLKAGKEEATDLLITSKKLTPHRLFMYLYEEKENTAS